MATIRVKKCRPAAHEVAVPGDKSMSHRAAILAGLSNGRCEISGFLPSEDCLCTVEAMRRLGAGVEFLDASRTRLAVTGHGLELAAPDGPIDCGNSGTMMRLLAGVLARQSFASRLVGDASLSGRPMGRILRPLREMGAVIHAEGPGECAPLVIEGSAGLDPIRYEMPVASAQVKSAILLAGMGVSGRTAVVEPAPTRDHTERMMAHFLVRTRREGGEVSIYGRQTPESRDFFVPGDISSAAFWLVAAAAMPGARVAVRGVGLNPTRTGVLDVLARMGARFADRLADTDQGEPFGTVTVEGGVLRGVTIGGAEIPNVIDELPILAVAGALAQGRTIIRDAAELRVKESDRIAVVARHLKAMGASVVERDDGLEIEGGAPLRGAVVSSCGDHRIAMAFAIAGLFAAGETVIEDTDCVATSYPGFASDLAAWCRRPEAPAVERGGAVD